MTFDMRRLVGWAVPLFCIALAAFLIFRQHAAAQQASTDLVAAQQDEAAATAAKEEAERSSGTMRFAAAAPNTTEEPKFLDGLRAQAALAGIKISRWSSQAEPASTAAPDAAPNENSPLKNIVKIRGQISLAGPYSGIRTFLAALDRSNRLYTFSDMRWSRKEKGDLELTATITRYVDPTLIAEPVGKGQKRT